MELKNLIGEYNFLTPKQVSIFLRTFKDVNNFTDSTVVSEKGDGVVDKSVRYVKDYGLNRKRTLTETHWFNLLCFLLGKISNLYFQDREINNRIQKISDLVLLKYTKGGFYKTHCDSGTHNHRELSAVIFLNNDYEGGHLQFFEPNSKDLILDVKPDVGKVVLWPSNYLFPHQATPVTKGTRYTIVSWMV